MLLSTKQGKLKQPMVCWMGSQDPCLPSAQLLLACFKDAGMVLISAWCWSMAVLSPTEMMQ